jgi:hypothetical protein
MHPSGCISGDRHKGDGENSVFERELPDSDIVISQPFWPVYLTAERFAKG